MSNNKEELKELPDKWYCKVTKDNQEILNTWRRTICGDNWKPCHVDIDSYIVSKHICDDSYYYYNNNIKGNFNYKDYQEISFEDFKRLVLKEPKFKYGDKVVAKNPDNFIDLKGNKIPNIYTCFVIDKVLCENTTTIKGLLSTYCVKFTDLELYTETKEKPMITTENKTQAIKIPEDLLFTYYKASQPHQKEYLNKHFQLDGSTTVEAIKGLYDIACPDWKPKIKANHPDCFKKEKVWKRNDINYKGKKFHFLTDTISVEYEECSSHNSNANLNFTFPTEEEANNNVLLYNTMMLMRSWAKFYNEVDGFKADWTESGVGKHGICIKNESLVTDIFSSSNYFLFQITVSSFKRAEEMLAEFKDDLEKLISLGMFN